MHEMFLMFVLSSCNLIYCFGFQPFFFYPCCVSLYLLNIRRVLGCKELYYRINTEFLHTCKV